MSEFDNISGIKVKDTELRSGINTLRNNVVSQTIKPLNVTKNDTYTADPTAGTYGYSPITVDVVEEPWEPLEDGYSNFWFDLTNDTLSPWLNFSAKNNNAVIDWGDGSGEVALDTLTPTHTYSKAGKYIIKVKGVTGIARQYTQPLNNPIYQTVLKHVECNNEITELQASAFYMAFGLEDICMTNNITTIKQNAFNFAINIKELKIPTSITVLENSVLRFMIGLQKLELPNGLIDFGQSQQYIETLKSITIPALVTNIGNNSLSAMANLTEIHMLPTTPPTIGTSIFNAIPSNYVIYVPVGTLSAYQTAWSDFADHIVEEGSSLSVQQLRKIAEETDNEEMR